MRVIWQFLSDSGLYESEEEASKRVEVLGRIGQVICGYLFRFFHHIVFLVSC